MNANKYLSNFKHRYRHTLAKPFLCILKEKHGTRHFHCPTIDTVLAVALAIVTERHIDGAYEYEPDRATLGMTPDEIQALPEGSIRTLALQALEQHRRNEQQDHELAIYARMATQAVAEGNGVLALWVLEHRSDYEYEGFELEAYDEIGPPALSPTTES